MTKARILADYVGSGDELALKAPLASPAFTGTPTGITAAHLEAGVLPSDVTGGSGLDKNGWILLETQTASNAGSLHIGSATTLSSTYDDYMIVGTSIRTHSAGNMIFKMTIGGVEKTSDYKTIARGTDSNASSTHTNSNGYAYAFMTSGVSTNNNDYDRLEFKMYLSSPTSTVYRHKVWGIAAYTTNQGYVRNSEFSARHDNTGVLTRMYFASSGNTTGTFKLYGLTK